MATARSTDPRPSASLTADLVARGHDPWRGDSKVRAREKPPHAGAHVPASGIGVAGKGPGLSPAASLRPAVASPSRPADPSADSGDAGGHSEGGPENPGRDCLALQGDLPSPLSSCLPRRAARRVQAPTDGNLEGMLKDAGIFIAVFSVACAAMLAVLMGSV